MISKAHLFIVGLALAAAMAVAPRAQAQIWGETTYSANQTVHIASSTVPDMSRGCSGARCSNKAGEGLIVA